MYKGYLVFLGFALALLWMAGLGVPASPVMTWFDGICAVLAFVGAAGTTETTPRRRVATGLTLLSLALFAVWLGGAMNNAVPWQTGWTLAFAVITLIMAFDAGLSNRPIAVRRTSTVERSARYRSRDRDRDRGDRAA